MENKTEVLNNMTEVKNLDGIYNRLMEATASDLWEVYGSHSYAKERAFEYCKNLMYKLDGYGMKIIGHNCMTFSVAFTFEYENRPCIAYITKSYDRWAYLD